MAENCFKTISKRNAMMVLDSDGMMREEYKNTINRFSSRLKHVGIAFETILKERKFVLVQNKEKSLDMN